MFPGETVTLLLTTCQSRRRHFLFFFAEATLEFPSVAHDLNLVSLVILIQHTKKVCNSVNVYMCLKNSTFIF